MSDLQRVGPSFGGTGTAQPFTADMTGAQRTADAHGRYAFASRTGQLFVASNVGAQALSVALTTTYTGLCISNPLGNTKNLEILAAGFAVTVAPGGIASIHVIAGYSATANVTHTAALASPGIQNCLIGTGPASSAKADTQATITNPGYLIPLLSGNTSAALPTSIAPVWVDLAGLITVPPGGWVAIGALTAETGFSAFAWEETPILA